MWQVGQGIPTPRSQLAHAMDSLWSWRITTSMPTPDDVKEPTQQSQTAMSRCCGAIRSSNWTGWLQACRYDCHSSSPTAKHEPTQRATYQSSLYLMLLPKPLWYCLVGMPCMFRCARLSYWRRSQGGIWCRPPRSGRLLHWHRRRILPHTCHKEAHPRSQ